MNKIKNLKISLMETDKNNPSDEENKKNFISRHTGNLNVDEVISYTDNKEYKDFIFESVSLIYDSLLDINENSKHKCDSVGIWVTFENGEELDNSIQISVLDDIEKYGSDDIEPIKEFFKMTLEEN